MHRSRTPNTVTVCIVALLSSLAAAPTLAAPAKSKPYVKGTSQMAGGQGQFGQTYTVVSSDGFGPVNFTLVSAEYSVVRANFGPGVSVAPAAGEKLLVIHYRLKNPNTGDMYYSSRSLFQAIDANNNTIEDYGTSRQLSEQAPIEFTMKPGQGIDDLMTCVVVPAQGAITKLILKLGRAGSTDLVTRYNLGSAPNIVKPIPAPYADAADKSGVTALATVQAAVGTVYTAGFFDISVDSIALTPGPLGSLTADDGKQFLVVNLTATNRAFGHIYCGQMFAPAVKTDDGKIIDYEQLKAKHDDPFEGETVEPGDSVSQRLVVQVPKDAQLKTLSLTEAEDNSGSISRAFVYDLSGVK